MAEYEGIEKYCGGEFWNATLTNSPSPEFTPCFEQTVLVWSPCVFLWLFAIFHFISLHNSNNEKIKIGKLHIAKLITTALIFLLMMVQLFYRVYEHSQFGTKYPPMEYGTPSVIAVTMILAFIMQIHTRLKGEVTSGVLSLFWFFFICTMILPFITLIQTSINQNGHPDLFSFVVFYTFFALLLVELVLVSIAEAMPDEERVCPELRSSFFNQLFFVWFTPLIVLGYKKPLVQDDLWHLNKRDTTDVVAPKLARHWEEEVEKSRLSREKNANKMSGEVYANVGIEEIKFEKSKTKFDLEEKYHKPSLSWAMVRTYGMTMLAAAFFKLINDTIQFLNPILLGLIINYTEDESIYQWLGITYAVAMYAVAFTQTIVLHQYFHRCYLVGMRIRTAIISIVYKKALRISNSARQESTVGEIVNLMSTDAQRFMDLMAYINILWSGPYVIIIAIWQLWRYLGPSVLAGVGVMILLIPVNGWIATRLRTLSAKNMILKDKRIKLMNEVLNGIKVLKLYAWEPSFQKQITVIRNQELVVGKKIAYLRAFMIFMWTIAPFLVTLCSFAVYVLVGNILDSETAWVSLALFNILRFPMIMFPNIIASMSQARVSSKRLTKFLLNNEIDPSSVDRNPDSAYDVSIKDGTFAWEIKSQVVLNEINLDIKPGKLVAVVGQVGSGKSSLVSAILGEMDKRAGSVSVRGSVAYVSQQAWIQNATLKDNILFGKKIKNDDKNSSVNSDDENCMGYVTDEQYTKIIKATAMSHDLKILPAGDQTEIGEKGINLSGGQKQRVSMARAICSDCDIYLLDDPLSAVDSHIGKHIFNHVISKDGILKDKTRILVTHGVQYLPEVDFIVVMKDGMITELGSYSELMNKGEDFAKFLNEFANMKDEVDEIEEDYSSLDNEDLSSVPSSIDDVQDDQNSDSAISNMASGTDSLRNSIRSRHSIKRDKNANGSIRKRNIQKQISEHTESNENNDQKGEKLIEDEEVKEGTISYQVVKAYAKSIGAKYCTVILIALTLYQLAVVFGSGWLTLWTTYNDNANFTEGGDSEQLGKWLGGYTAFGVLQAIFIYYNNYAQATATIAAAAMLQEKLLANILKVPSQFFDTTPLGRIINRFSKDVYIVDEILPSSLRMFLMCMFSVVFTLAVIIFATPIFAAVIIPLAILYYFAQRYYVATSRQLKRLESVTRSPIYSHFGETVSGVSIIRAFRHQKRFMNYSEYQVDHNQECYYPNIVSNRWIAVRLEIIGNGIVFFAALFAVLARGTISASLAGLSISYSMTITQTLNWWVRQISEIETNIVAVERMKEYSEVEQEAEWYNADCKLDNEWPEKGKVSFRDYSTRYREGLNLVLKKINCDVEPGQKVGIVGRTGAGKSSLTLALFRLIEPAEGTIVIDDIDISKIGLHQLRNKLTIIPQDPVLFSGTMRINLDPFENYEDDQVWKSLELAHLKEYVAGLENKLEYPCSEGGENLSVGQRQLVCLARALLRKTKILILDEATAAVDMQTDELIQNTIRKEFADCTVITIAHRLNTIMDYDRVMVLDDGRIAEFGSPEELLDQGGVFHGMAQDAGLVNLVFFCILELRENCLKFQVAINDNL